MKKFCESLREHVMKIINFKKKKNEVINKRPAGIIRKANICYNCIEKVENKYLKDKKHQKFSDHCHYTEEYGGAPHSICNLKYSASKTISIVFHIYLTMIILLSKKN